MGVIEKARELGKELQKDPRYIEYAAAREKNDADGSLQALMEKLNAQKRELGDLMESGGDAEKITAVNTAMSDTYTEIMSNENMIRYKRAKEELDVVVNGMMNIISASMRGEDPDTASEETHSCGGDCSSCSGCR